MVNLPKDICCGCNGCNEICPVKAIIMKPDEYGFIYPKVDLELCIYCGACEKVCQYYNELQLQEPLHTFAAKTKDYQSILHSASGGLAHLISFNFIKNKGVVYGCMFENADKIQHIRLEHESDLDKIRGSKYVQSKIVNVYKNIRTDLLAQKKVLFIGTPCQVAGLKSFLVKYYENLITIDLICHGVPSDYLLKKYLVDCTHIKAEQLNKIKVQFRWKDPQAKKEKNRFGIKVLSNKGEPLTLSPCPANEYMAAFFGGFSYRWNCHKCIYATEKRIGDITLGDFWGLGSEIMTNLNVSDGISLVLINTIKGEGLFSEIQNNIEFEVHTLEEAKLRNKNLNNPTPAPANKINFLEDCNSENFRTATLKWIPNFKLENSLYWKTYIYVATAINKIPFLIKLKKKIFK